MKKKNYNLFLSKSLFYLFLSLLIWDIKEKVVKKNNEKKWKLMVGQIIAMKKVFLDVNGFYFMRRVLLRCFPSFIFMKK